jgi:hypothetical protein
LSRLAQSLQPLETCNRKLPQSLQPFISYNRKLPQSLQPFISYNRKLPHGHMVVGFTTTYAISAHYHLRCELESGSLQDVLDITLCDKGYQ